MPQLDARQALRLQVVKGVLVNALTLEQGAARLRIEPEELARLVEGARRAVIAALGEGAIEAYAASSAA